MPFKHVIEDEFSYLSPLDMFQDNKNKKILGVLDYQAEMIKSYMKHFSDKVIALELPTGCGKTLVGTLIGEFRRQKNREKTVYLCPTNQLVYQVVKMAKDNYGLSATAFCGKQSEYNNIDKTNYLMKKTIAVTTYSSYFADNSFFEDAETIIMDDVHSAEDYIVSNWSVGFDNSNPAFEQVVSLIRPYISENAYNLLCDSDVLHPVSNFCDLVPMPLISEKITELYAILDSNLSLDTNLKYSWNRIASHLKACNLFISKNRILIRPLIPPTLTCSYLNNAKQILLMSATLGRCGELERLTGLYNIIRLPIVDDWDKKGIGRRFFVFPEFVLGDKERINIITALHNKFSKSVVLVGNNTIADKLSQAVKTVLPKVKVLTSSSILKDKKEFLDSDNAMLILSNRFDGIDFADEVCRLLIVYNLPKVTNTQERFLVSSMAAASMFNERIRMRITQAVGRCTRNPSDFSVVCVLGDSLNSELTKDERLRHFMPELRAEIKYGLENSMEFESLDDLLDQTDEFCNKTRMWKSVERQIVALRDSYSSEKYDDDKKVEENLANSAINEVKYQYALWSNDYEKSYNYSYDVVKCLNHKSLKGYRSFWHYLTGCSAYFLSLDGRSEYEFKSKEFFNRASDSLISVSWMSSLNNKLFTSVNVQQNANDDMFSDIIVRIENNFSKYPFMKKLEDEISTALSDIMSNDGERFERGHQKIGELLGFVSENPDGDGEPDPIWYANNSVVVVTEDKVYQDNGSGIKKIPLIHVREATGHITWLKTKRPNLSKARIIPLFISNSDHIEDSARVEADQLFYCKIDSFITWCNNAMNVLLESYKIFSCEGDIDWRESVHNKFVCEKITPKDFYEFVSKRKLVDL